MLDIFQIHPDIEIHPASRIEKESKITQKFLRVGFGDDADGYIHHQTPGI